jgi:hemerythrin-like domain-containing protein
MPDAFDSSCTMGALRRILNDDHAAIQAVFERAIGALRGDDLALRERIWLELDERLRAHMTLEEEHVFPELERIDRAEVHALTAEHCRIRALLRELDIDLELSLGAESMLMELAELLHAHVARENALLYRWCDESLSEGARDALRGRLARTLAQAACGHTHGTDS